MFPDYTGIIHISGIADPVLGLADMRDEHRGLVDQEDRIGNVQQIADLLAAGYSGAVSFEPFAAGVREMSAPKDAYARSFDFIEAGLTR